MSDNEISGYEPGLLHLRVRELVLLELINDCGSLRGAAEALHVTQPAITQALRALEHAFDAVLVRRGTRGENRTQLTAAGLVALQRLRVVGEELRMARQAATHGHGERQELRLGTLPFVAMDWLPGALALHARSQPLVRVTLSEATVSELWKLLADGKVDLIANFLLPPGEMRAQSSELIHCVIESAKVVPVAPASHPLFRRKTIQLAYLARQRWVFPPPEAQAHAELIGAFMKGGVRAPEPELVAERHLTRMALAQRLNLLTVIPLSALKWQLGGPRLKQLPGELLCWSADFVLAARKSSLHTPAANAFYTLFS
jgi:DNA-binding transcriptional LysR family regulator